MPSRNPVLKERSKSAPAVAGWSYLGYRHKKLIFRLKKPKAQHLTSSGQTLHRKRSTPQIPSKHQGLSPSSSDTSNSSMPARQEYLESQGRGFSWYNHPISCLNCTNNGVFTINSLLYLETAHPNRHREAITAKEALITHRHFC